MFTVEAAGEQALSQEEGQVRRRRRRCSQLS
jgi:hypothetical protein